MPTSRIKFTIYRLAIAFFGLLERRAPAWMAAAFYWPWSKFMRRTLVPGTRSAALAVYRPSPLAAAAPSAEAEAAAAPGKIGIVIPTKNHPEWLRRCLESVYARAEAGPLDTVVVNNGDAPLDADPLRALSATHRLRVIDAPGPFNWSAFNNRAARELDVDLLLFLNDDIEAVTGGFLREMAEIAADPEVGAVGALLCHPGGTVQHAGIYAEKGRAKHYAFLLPRKLARRNPMLAERLRVSAVTGACLMVQKRVYDEAGGFDEGLAISSNDVDFCFRLLDRGYVNVMTGRAELLHREMATRGHYSQSREAIRREQMERGVLAKRHAGHLRKDPCLPPPGTATPKTPCAPA